MAPSSSTSSVRAARARKGDITYIASHLSSSTQNIVQPTSRLSHIQHLHYDLDSVTVSLFVFYIRFDKYTIRYYCETSRLVYIATQRSNFDSITHSLCVLIILGKISQKTFQVLANCLNQIGDIYIGEYPSSAQGSGHRVFSSLLSLLFPIAVLNVNLKM